MRNSTNTQFGFTLVMLGVLVTLSSCIAVLPPASASLALPGVEYDDAYIKAIRAMRETGYGPTQSDKASGLIGSTRVGISALATGGDAMQLFIERTPGGVTTNVTVSGARASTDSKRFIEIYKSYFQK